MGERAGGVHPAWISVAGFAGAAVALVGAWIPLTSTRTRLATAESDGTQLKRDLGEAKDLNRKLAEREAALTAEKASALKRASASSEELEAANEELGRLRLRLARKRAEQQRERKRPPQDSPQEARRLQAEARSQMRAGNPRKALRSLTAAIRVDPKNADLYVDRSFVRLKGQDVPGAIADCEAALRINSSHAMAWNNLAMIRLRQGDGPTALKLSRRALQCDPNLVNAWIMRMGAAAKAEKWDEVELAARGALERLKSSDPRRRMVKSTLENARARRAAGTPAPQRSPGE
ncbi:MAG: tetratricopeptide repeat protein [Planctomycetes bacterium]|nr:tetratricopeptide repeat protein [Planctomycetota bacterium]